MNNWLRIGAILTLLCPVLGHTETHSGFPVDIATGPAPRPIVAGGRLRLVYELRLVNVAPIPIEILSLDVFNGDSSMVLGSFHGEALQKLLVPVENVLLSTDPEESGAKTRAVAGGHSVVIFIELTLDANARAPKELSHRFSFDIARNASLNRIVNGPKIAVVQEPVLVLKAPLAGSAWVAFNAFSAYDHRRAFVTVDGKLTVAQRFAIDWMRLGSDGRLFHGDSKSNASFYGYGAEVLAVSAARVSDLKDGIPDNGGDNKRSDRHVTVDDAVGNYVILDLGGGQFAVYAHLQPGSIRVKIGEKVGVGQVLALLGNSGNSDAPHLHFHVVNGSSPMAAEGLPYEFAEFNQLGILQDSKALDAGEPWRQQPHTKPALLRLEFPVDGAVVAFP